MKVIILSYGEPVGADAIRMVSKAVKWHRRPGKIKSYKNSGSGGGNSNSKRRHYTSIIVANAMALGWLNGRRIGRRK